MFNRNNVFAGFTFSFLLPIAIMGLLWVFFSLLDRGGAVSNIGLSPDFRIRTLAIVAIAANIWPMRMFQRKRWSESIRGVVLATSLLSILWVAYFFFLKDKL